LDTVDIRHSEATDAAAERLQIALEDIGVGLQAGNAGHARLAAIERSGTAGGCDAGRRVRRCRYEKSGLNGDQLDMPAPDLYAAIALISLGDLVFP
jgi:hypothetical protein